MFKTSSVLASVLLVVGLVGCAGSQGTAPQDMSAAQHEAMANQEDKAAAEHEAQHDPNASVATERCGKGAPCWTSTSNPTQKHASDAESHKDMAVEPPLVDRPLTYRVRGYIYASCLQGSQPNHLLGQRRKLPGMPSQWMRTRKVPT